jgi:8-oxo-dGTP diphosphatase
VSVGGWDGAPVFGERAAGADYVVRASAYGVVEGVWGLLALVRTPRGVYLPGGGMEAGETPEGAVEREALEECGLLVRAGAWRARAVQFTYPEDEQTHFEKYCVFVGAAVVGCEGRGAEDDHQLFWADPAEAARLLTHESQRWAVTRWMSAQA